MEQKLRKPSLYDHDFYGWTQEQASLLRQGRLQDADIGNLVEEIETLGRSERRELESAFRLICMHLLKMIYQPSRASRSWVQTIVRERNNAESIFESSPSLKGERLEIFARAYRQARKEAAAETVMMLDTFPVDPPFTADQIQDEGFAPLTLVESSPVTTTDHEQPHGADQD